jgi:predicted transcriptional regulator
MARTQISIKLDPDTLQALDEAAELMKLSRTAFIEEAVKRRLGEIDSVIDDMSRQGGAEAKLYDAITTQPTLMKALSRVLATHLSSDDIDGMIDRTPALRSKAQERRSVRKTQRKKKGGIDA